ncbi:MAG TPA: hypothetical protein VJZ00_21270 [Thermoanaerobaculia bacterium]|nr:hypothetical protein [Thermoanaerobaculia bacterium]
MNRRPDLIVPIRDRRQHKRYLTLKNAAIASAIAFVAFIGVSIYSEVRRPGTSDYGRIAARELPPPPTAQKPVDVVREAPAINDEAHADPMLVEPMGRAQWLGDETSNAAVMITPTASTPVATVRGSGVAIVDGPQGVTIVQQQQKRAVLSGGFGRR